MAFAELVTLLRLDTTQYEREWKRIVDLTNREMTQRVIQLHPSVTGGIAGLYGGGGSFGRSAGVSAGSAEAGTFLNSGRGSVGGFGGAGAFIQPASIRNAEEAARNFYKVHQEIAKSDSLLQQMGNHIIAAGDNLASGLVAGFKQIASVVGIGASIGIVGGVATLIKQGFQLNREWEKNRISIASVLQLTTDLVDAQGKAVDPTKAMAMNIDEAEKLMNKLRDAAVKTVLTTEQAVNAFKTGVGFATSAGISPEKAVPLITNIANIATALGARGERQQQFEVRSLLTGQFINRSRIGQVLGLSSQDIQREREAGTLLQFLTEKLEAAQKFADKFATSFQGAMTTLTSKANEFIRLATENSVKSITDAVVDLNKSISEGKIREWSKQFADGVNLIKQAFLDFGHSEAFGYLKFLANSVATAGKFYAEPLVNELHAAQGEANLQQMNARRGTEQLALQNAMRAVERRRGALEAFQNQALPGAVARGEQMGMGTRAIFTADQSRQMRVMQYALKQAQDEQTKAEEALKLAHIRNELARGGASIEGIHRVAKEREADHEKARKAAEAERLFIAREYAKLADDKIAKIREEAEAEVLNVDKHVKEEAKRAALIKTIWEHAHSEAQKIRDKDAQDQKDTFNDLSKDERDIIKDRLDAVHNQYKERQGIIKATYELEKNTARELTRLHKEEERAIREQTRAIEDQALASQRLGVAGIQSHNQVLRARFDRFANQNLAASTVFNPATGERTQGFSSRSNSLMQQLTNIFAQQEGPVSINSQGEAIPMVGRGAESVDAVRRGRARAATTLRDIREQLVGGGDVGGAVSQLSKLGVDLSGPGGEQLIKGLRNMRTDVLEGKVMEGGAADQEQENQVTRGMEDARQRATDAGQQIKDVQERMSDLQESYADTIKDLNERFRNALRTTTESLIKASEAAKKFLDDLSGTRIRVPARERSFIQQLANVTPTRAGAIAQSQLAPVHHIVFQAGSINISGVKELDLKKAAEQLQTAMHSASPARR